MNQQMNPQLKQHQSRISELRTEIVQLKLKHDLSVGLQNMLKTDPEMVSDPRQPIALQTQIEQQKIIDGELAKLEKELRQLQGIPEPEPVIVGLNAAKLVGTVVK